MHYATGALERRLLHKAKGGTEVSEETGLLRRWGVLQDNLVLSTDRKIVGDRKEIRKLALTTVMYFS